MEGNHKGCPYGGGSTPGSPRGEAEGTGLTPWPPLHHVERGDEGNHKGCPDGGGSTPGSLRGEAGGDGPHPLAPSPSQSDREGEWIPAFAGMTGGRAGMTGRGRG